jgi:VanZ family protein
VFFLALTLALAYLLVIVYASLQPFRGWRLPADEVYHFLFAPWPLYITLSDVLYNVCAYVPLGFLLTLGLRLALSPTAAVIVATLLAVLLSMGMEGIQMFLSARVASNVDVLANFVGALVGALAGPLFAPSHTIGARMAGLRDRIFLPGALVDVGLVLAALWIATFLNPWARVFGPGHLRASIDLPFELTHTAYRLLSAEAVVVLFNVLGMGMFLSALLRPETRRSTVIAAFVVLALAMKIAAAWLLGKPQGSWLGVTPGMLMGVGLSVALLYGTLAFSRSARLMTAMMCLTLALLAINLAPDNPYFSLPPQIARAPNTHFLSFWYIMRSLSELWPLFAIPYLFIAWRRQHRQTRLIMRNPSHQPERGKS